MAHLTTRFFADTLGMCTRCEVLLPDRPVADRPIPALYLLHGLSDDETIWMRRSQIELFANRYYLAIVMPNGDKSFYCNLRNEAAYYTYLQEELPALMEGYFPLSKEREGRFVAGLSMGGFGAFKLALNNPSRYAAVAGMSSVCSLAWPKEARPAIFTSIFGEGEGTLTGTENDLFAAATAVSRLPAPQRPKIFQYCGVDDFLWKANLELKAHFEGLNFDYHWEEGPGGHCWENWNHEIERILEWLPLSENKVKTGAIGI